MHKTLIILNFFLLTVILYDLVSGMRDKNNWELVICGVFLGVWKLKLSLKFVF